MRYESDEERRLATVTAEIRAAREKLAAQTEVRDSLIEELRGRGLPMRRLVLLTGYTDSYLSRIAIKRGQPRRAVR